MMYICIVIEVTQKMSPHRIIVRIPGTHPRTLKATSKLYEMRYSKERVTHERDHDCAMMARQTCSPASKQAVFCHDIVRSLI
jgi:CHAD domain-containing protein